MRLYWQTTLGYFMALQQEKLFSVPHAWWVGNNLAAGDWHTKHYPCIHLDRGKQHENLNQDCWDSNFSEHYWFYNTSSTMQVR
jgi:hypothetical protein